MGIVLKILVIGYLVYMVLRAVLRFTLRKVVAKQFEKFKEAQNQQGKGEQKEPLQRRKNPNKREQRGYEGGDYVDFEEL